MFPQVARAVTANGNRPTPVIFGNFVNVLGLVRGLHATGLVSVVIDEKPGAAFASRFAEGVIAPSPRTNPGEFERFAGKLVRDLPCGGVLFVTSDIYLKAVLGIRATLEPHLSYGMSPNATMNLFLSKIATMNLARELNVDIPATIEIRGRNLADVKGYSPFPALLKPSVTIGFIQALGRNCKALVVQDPSELKPLQEELLAAGLGETEFVFQEFVPGDARNLFTISTFSDQEGRILAYSTGHKIRQYPPATGTICCGRVVPTPELFAPTQRLFEATKLHAIANTEFKRDPRDGRFKLMEVNPRPGMWNYSATATGVNLPLMAYEYVASRRSPSTVVKSDQEIIWLVSLEYLLSLIVDRGILSTFLMPWRWWPEIAGRRVFGVFNRADPLPAVANLFHLARLAWKRAIRPIHRWFRARHASGPMASIKN